ncbi:hypothetical protein D3C72_1910670 [compost metagenome]
MIGLEPEQLLNLRVMHFIGLQVPVPQPEFAGFQGQRQTRLTFAKGLIGRVQLQAALGDTAFQFDLNLPQFILGPSALVDFLGQLLIELVAVVLSLLQMLDQRLVLKTP